MRDFSAKPGNERIEDVGGLSGIGTVNDSDGKLVELCQINCFTITNIEIILDDGGHGRAQEERSGQRGVLINDNHLDTLSSPHCSRIHLSLRTGRKQGNHSLRVDLSIISTPAGYDENKNSRRRAGKTTVYKRNLRQSKQEGKAISPLCSLKTTTWCPMTRDQPLLNRFSNSSCSGFKTIGIFNR
ncbi:hypothetical protein PoB_000243200 [Plakobranchus ocellatus]|uniref:FHA domain-containing protein n=1 Tax=Plakobranchus ocellatus TaxID=259542 RepID=A0AAV3Y0F5_9GAST|nr:hypothetical protein PoB_000243200 [Plakobranchus ocellatus]